VAISQRVVALTNRCPREVNEDPRYLLFESGPFGDFEAPL
jgi:hypothetical protein